MHHSSLVLLTLSSLATSLVSAAPTITFEGEVTTQTCQATINGHANALVMLPTVAVKDFDNGDTPGLTPFTVSISGCEINNDKDLPIKVKFLGHNVTPGGNLGNTAADNGVAVQLLDKDDDDTGTPIKMANSGDLIIASADSLKLKKGTTSAEHTFAARYINESGKSVPTAGKVTAVVEYTLSYL